MSRLTSIIGVLAGALTAALPVCAAPADTLEVTVTPAGGRYFAGEQLTRTVTCTGAQGKAVCRWATALFGDQVIEDGSVELTPVDGVARGELVTTLPEVTQRLTLTLAVRISVGDEAPVDREFHESIFPPEPVTLDAETRRRLNVGLLDPSGETARVLTRMKVPFARLSSSLGLQTFSGNLIILGEGRTLAQAPASLLIADERARQGLTVIVLAQETWPRGRFRPPWLPAPVAGTRNRGAEVLSTQEELTRGLLTGDLSNWRVPTAPGREGTWESATWGALALPRCSNVCNHLSAADGLASASSLFGYRAGEGQVLVTTLPIVSAYDSEPAARTVMRNLLLLAACPRPEWKQTAVWGDPEGAVLRWLADRGLEAPVNRLGLADADVVVIDGLVPLATVFPKDGEEPARGLERFLRRGGTALILGMTQETLADYRSLLPADLSLKRMRLGEFTMKREEPLTWGVPQHALRTLRATLGALDLPEFQPGPKAEAVTDPPMVTRSAVGEGALIVAQLPFWEVKAENGGPYVLAQMLTNLRVRLAEPGERRQAAK